MKIVWGRSIGFNIELNKMVQLTRPIPNEKPMEYTIIEDGAGCYPWSKVYAWLPVKTISGERVWLERLLRRRVWVVWGTGFHMEPEIQYATVFDLISN